MEETVEHRQAAKQQEEDGERRQTNRARHRHRRGSA
jgi:hypothetical protein